jgi:hypothetical protein
LKFGHITRWLVGELPLDKIDEINDR